MNIAVHPIAPEEIMALLDAELPAERAPVVDAHLEECSSCGSIAKALRGSSEGLAHWVVPAAPAQAQFEAGLFETARRVSRERANRGAVFARSLLRRHWLVSSVAMASVLLLVLRSLVMFAPVPQLYESMKEAGHAEAPVNKAKTVRDIHAPSASVTLDGNANAAGDGIKNYPVDLARVEEFQPVASALPTPPSAPMIARTVSLAIVAKDFGSVRAGLDAILARHRGYAASLAANTQQNSARSLQASLRIPANELVATIGELKALGQVQSESQTGEEVTQQNADLVARLKNSRETERRLQAILENRTGKISDVLEVEQEIARVRGEIEQMEAEQQGLEHRVSFATVDLTLAEEYKAQIGQVLPSISTRIHNAMIAGYRDAVENLVGIVLFCAEYGPSLMIWVAFLAPIAWILRRRWMRASAAVQSVSA